MHHRGVAIWVAVTAVVVVLVGLVIGGAVRRGESGYGMMGGYYGPSFGHGGGILALLICVLIFGGVVLFIAWLARGAGHASTWCSGQENTALDIVKRRYARGEITKEQFDQIKRDME